MKKAFKLKAIQAKAFTLIEILVVIAILSVLAVVVFVALNPGQRIKDAQDARRSSDLDSILTAVHQYIIDNSGLLPAGLTAGMSQMQLGTSLGTGGTEPTCVISDVPAECDITGATDCVDLETPTDLDPYLKSIPKDPVAGTDKNTRYAIEVNSDSIVTVTACDADSPPISVSR